MPTIVRPPTETASPRMQPLARLPVFFALEGRRVVVVGGNAAAAWKAELLSAAGAAIEVFASNVGEEMAAILAEPPRGPITLYRRAWAAGDLVGAALAVGACETDEDAARFAAAARASGVPVNVIDRPDFCDFSFGAIVNRSPLVIGISTAGAAPAFGQAVRARLETFLPRGFAAWAEAARHWRSALAGSGLPFAARRRFWQLFSAFAVNNPRRAPAQDDYERLLASLAEQREAAEQGSVTLVGAGPGDPELLTLRATRALQSADVILFDSLVSAEVLDFARREAKKMLVGKTGHGPSCRQADINALMVRLAKSGRRVVRLKGGDPLIFGRAGEEIEACRNAGIAVEVVPGITAAQGAAARLNVSLTHRDKARRLQYIAGHGADGALPADMDWASLSDPATTSVVYMPAKTLPELVARGVAGGLDPTTPAVAVARATCPDQNILAAPVLELAERLAAAEFQGPVLVMIGRTLEGAAAACEERGTDPIGPARAQGGSACEASPG